MTIDAFDRAHMARALELATDAVGLSDPNPRVGCVLVDSKGKVVAEGFTQQAGGPHAEAAALEQARLAGADLRGGTAWVTLEPCAHHGRTPPCCDALSAAGLARVVVAISDPYPRVAGAGLQRLRSAGITVNLLEADDQLAQAAREINIGFFSRFERQRPWVRLKVAMSLDGRTALTNGTSQWITSESARIDGHRWRKRASAIVTGIGTVLSDRPRMDVRLVPTQLQPLRVVLDSQLRIPMDAPILAPPGRCLVVTTEQAASTRAAALAMQGVEVERCGAQGARIDLRQLLNVLTTREVNELHVEAGPTLNGAWMAMDLVDELLVYLAPRVLGSGRGMAEWGPIARLEDALALRLTSIDPIGTDLRLTFRRS